MRDDRREPIARPAPAGTKGERLATGGTSEIFEWAPGWVLKLYVPGFPPSLAASESATAAFAHAAGIPTPPVGDAVEIDGRMGFPMARVDGPMLADELWTDVEPDATPRAAAVAATLHAQMHRTAAAELPSARAFHLQLVQECNAIDHRRRTAVADTLRDLPDGTRLCHGDFHAGNILMTDDGPVVIDWGVGHRGHPPLDAALSWVGMTEWLAIGLDDNQTQALQKFIDGYTTSYLDLMRHGSPAADPPSLEPCIPIAAAIRLALPHPASSDEILHDLVDGV